jgi:hypothetical protein
MFALNDKNTKLGLLALSTVGVVMLLSYNKKSLGKRTVMLGNVLVVVVALLFGASVMKDNSMHVTEDFYFDDNLRGIEDEPEQVVEQFEDPTPNNETALEQKEVEEGSGRDTKTAGCVPLETLNPDELLPNADSDNIWDTPANPGDISGANFLDAGYHIGVNTVGQSLRNANRQLRSEPANPQVKVSPWLQSTIEADVNRRPLEIGA